MYAQNITFLLVKKTNLATFYLVCECKVSTVLPLCGDELSEQQPGLQLNNNNNNNPRWKPWKYLSLILLI